MFRFVPCVSQVGAKTNYIVTEIVLFSANLFPVSEMCSEIEKRLNKMTAMYV